MKKVIFIIALVFLSVSALNAQTENQKWTKIVSPKGDFTALLPADFLVDNEDGEYRAYACRDEVTIRIELENSGQAKSRLKEIRRFRTATEGKVSAFTLGDFIGDVYINETDKYFSMSISAASSKGFYSIWVSTKNKKSPAWETFLNSITFDTRTLLKQPNQTIQNTETAISLASLNTSANVLEALQKPDATKTIVKYELEEEKEEKTENTTKYSRPLFVIRRPVANYTDSGRQNGVQGIVKLKVVFRADGQIGEITVLKKLKEGLTEKAIEAARKMKFLPAEIDGKAVDTPKNVSYSFTVY